MIHIVVFEKYSKRRACCTRFNERIIKFLNLCKRLKDFNILLLSHGGKANWAKWISPFHQKLDVSLAHGLGSGWACMGLELS